MLKTAKNRRRVRRLRIRAEKWVSASLSGHRAGAVRDIDVVFVNLPCVITTCEVKAGDELLLDYDVLDEDDE
jgi:hypothetical protein